MKNLIIFLAPLFLFSCSGGPTSSDVDLLATGEINELICEEECIIEGVNLKDVELESVNLKNISFQNSYFENVIIKGSQDKFTVLDNIKFIDSEIKNLSIEDFVITYDPSNFDLVYLNDAMKSKCAFLEDEDWNDEKFWETRKKCRDEFLKINLKPLEELKSDWELDFSDFKNWRDGFDSYKSIILIQLYVVGWSTENAKKLIKDGMSIHFQNVTGSIDMTDVQNSFIITKATNSTFNKFAVEVWGDALVYTYANNSNFKKLSYWHSLGIGRNDEVFMSRSDTTAAFPILSLKDSKIEFLDMLNVGDRALFCDNSDFENGNLFMVVDYCEDMGINFDEFAYRDSTKSFIPDNSMSRLKDFIGSDYKNLYVGEIIKGFDSQAANKENQLYAIASGDSDFLISYLDGLYKYMFLNNGWIHQPKYCNNDHSLLIFDWNSHSDDFCSTEKTRIYTIGQWNDLPELFKTKLDEKTQNFVETVIDNSISKKDKELFITSYVEENHDFSSLKNCLRTKDIRSVRENLRALKDVPEKSSPYYQRTSNREKATRARMQQKASELAKIQDFKECIENNVSIFSQVNDSYGPIEKLNSFVDREIKNYSNEKERQRIAAEKKRRAEREKLYTTYVKNVPEYCEILGTSTGSELINMYYSGNADQKRNRTQRALNSCYRCTFNFWSNMLGDDDFLKLANGDRDNISTDMSAFGVADLKKMMMCPVAGADPKVRREYALMMQ